MTSTEFDSLPRIIRAIPAHCLAPNNWKSFASLGRDIIFIAFFAWSVLAADSWIFGPLLGILLGFSVGALFSIGHDCGHRSFSRSVLVNNIVGHIATSPVFWPFHVWRIDHDDHHRHTSNVDHDTAWRPVTYRMWKRMPRLTQIVYLWTRTKLFFLGSIYSTYVHIKTGLKIGSSESHNPVQKAQIRLSMAVMFLIAGSYLALSIYAGGWYGFVCLFLIPQLVVHSLLSTFTFFHHTAPNNYFIDRKSWKAEVAQLSRTLHVRYPWMFEFFCHDINWHVPHHVCVGVPHYHLREAHYALKEKYPDIVQESKFGFKLIRETTSQCHFVKSKNPVDMSWISLEEAKRMEYTKAAEKNPRIVFEG